MARSEVPPAREREESDDGGGRGPHQEVARRRGTDTSAIGRRAAAPEAPLEPLATVISPIGWVSFVGQAPSSPPPTIRPCDGERLSWYRRRWRRRRFSCPSRRQAPPARHEPQPISSAPRSWMRSTSPGGPSPPRAFASSSRPSTPGTRSSPCRCARSPCVSARVRSGTATRCFAARTAGRCGGGASAGGATRPASGFRRCHGRSCATCSAPPASGAGRSSIACRGRAPRRRTTRGGGRRRASLGVDAADGTPGADAVDRPSLKRSLVGVATLPRGRVTGRRSCAARGVSGGAWRQRPACTWSASLFSVRR